MICLKRRKNDEEEEINSLILSIKDSIVCVGLFFHKGLGFERHLTNQM